MYSLFQSTDKSALLIVKLSIFLYISLVNGKFSDWKYEECSVSCGIGYQTGTRKCNSPKPKFGGNACAGDTEQTKECNVVPCPGMCVIDNILMGLCYPNDKISSESTSNKIMEFTLTYWHM